jgi:hypothetical protein
LTIILSRIEELEHQVNHLELQANSQRNEAKFFSTYRDWVHIFMNTLIIELGKEEQSHAKDALHRLKYNLTLTSEESECIKKLRGLLKNVNMTLDDVKLLHEIKSKGNIYHVS